MAETSAVVLIDGNNLGMTAQAAVMPLKGAHRRLYAGEVETTAIFGFLRTLRAIRADFGGRLIVLWDGRSWRYDAYPDYKGNRDGNDHMTAVRDAWKAQKPTLARILKALGVEQVVAGNMEADDLAARFRRIYAAQGRDVVLVSADSDWSQLVNDRTQLWDPMKSRRVTIANFAETTGYPRPSAMIDTKAMAGEPGDNIRPVGGVGAKTVAAIIERFGSVEGLINATLGDPALCEGLDRRILAFVEDEERHARYRFNRKLVDLDHRDAPKIGRLSHVKASLDEPALTELLEGCAFHTLLRDPSWLRAFKE